MKKIKFHGFFIFSLLISTPVSADFMEKMASEPVGPPDMTMNLLKVTGGLLLVIIAIFGSAWAYRRFGNLSPVSNDALRIIGGVSMGQKERVVLMQVGEEQILLGVSPGRIERLHVLTKNIEMKEQTASKNMSFSDQLSSVMKQRKG